MSDLDTNNIVEVKRRALKAQAVQFTGKNGAEIVAFIRSNEDNVDTTARNGGAYVKLTHVSGVTYNVRKSDWVIQDADGALIAFTDEQFRKLFLYKG